MKEAKAVLWSTATRHLPSVGVHIGKSRMARWRSGLVAAVGAAIQPRLQKRMCFPPASCKERPNNNNIITIIFYPVATPTGLIAMIKSCQLSVRPWLGSTVMGIC